MPKGIPLTQEEQARRRHEIFHQVVKIFIKKGFHETSMQEIADAAGLGKSTLYDYFRTKDEILVYFFEDQWNDVIEEAQKIAVQNCSADARLRKIMEVYMESLQANKNLFLKLSVESQHLKPDSQKQIQDQRHTYQDMLRALIDEGIREGVFRQVNSLLVARLLVGSIGLLLYGSRLTGTPQEMLQQTLDIFFNGTDIH
jgi:TetR/AcrR family transcriptional regulator, cholesterol catabolism regulator